MCQGVDGAMGTTLHLGHPSPALGIVPLCLAHPSATASALEPHPSRWDRPVEPSSSGGDGPYRAYQDPTEYTVRHKSWCRYREGPKLVVLPRRTRHARESTPYGGGTATAADSIRYPCTNLSSPFPTSVPMQASLQVLTFFHPCPCLLGPVGLARV